LFCWSCTARGQRLQFASLSSRCACHHAAHHLADQHRRSASFSGAEVVGHALAREHFVDEMRSQLELRSAP
jgi:hypothetical protein